MAAIDVSAIPAQTVRTPARTLDELAETANHEHAQAFDAAAAMVRHAINAGEALLAAKAQTASGEWTRWLEKRFVASPETALVYMRLAHHQDAILAHPEIRSISQARRFLREIGAVREEHGTQGRGVYVSESVRDEARALRKEGLELREIADMLGHSLSSIHYWCNPPAAEWRAHRQAQSKARRREVRRALQRERRAVAVADHGDKATAECYSMIRKTAQLVDRAHDGTQDREARAALSTALTKLHAAEDQIVRALGIT